MSDNDLSSSFGGDSDDGLIFFLDGASCFILHLHLLVSMDVDESIDLSILKSKTKWVKDFVKYYH